MGAEERTRWRLAMLACAIAGGLLFAAAAASSVGSDLRPAAGDATSIVRERTEQIAARRVEARRLQAEIDRLSLIARGSSAPDVPALMKAAGGLEPARGPGMRIELSDTPREMEFPDVNPNLLVVHQQDIQAFVNALWAGGAQAVALQGQRLVSTSGIKCVGNTVIIDGVPYSPPYVIEAIGDPARLSTALHDSPEVATYRAYVRDYQLGMIEETRADVSIDGYSGPVEFGFAKVLEPKPQG